MPQAWMDEGKNEQNLLQDAEFWINKYDETGDPRFLSEATTMLDRAKYVSEISKVEVLTLPVLRAAALKVFGSDGRI